MTNPLKGIARLHPLQEKHKDLVQTVIDQNNLDFNLQICSNDECEVGDYSIGLDFNLKGCWDTEEGKIPIRVVFNEILEVLPDNILRISLDEVRFDIK